MKKESLRLLMWGVCVCVLLVSRSITYGWGAIAHCTIGEHTGTGSGYNNVPDIWGSTSDFAGLIPFSISPYFCWSHEYKVTAPEGFYRRMYAPTLNTRLGAEDDSPCHYFDVLVEKIEPARITTVVQSVIRGWRAHNTADQIVHYELFPAPASGGLLTIKRIWSNHSEWENAVEKIVYVKILYGGQTDLAFNTAGKAVGYDFASGIVCGDADSDRILSLAQKVFRKKQATVDVLEMWGLDVQTPHEIRRLREAKTRTLAKKNLFNFFLSDYEKATRINEIKNWETYFNRAEAAVRALP